MLFRVNCAGALLQVLLQLALIPLLGLRGAAIAVVATAVTTHATLYLLPETRTWVRPCVHAVLGAVAVAGVLLVLVHALPLGPFARAAASLLAFVVALPVVGVAGPGDVHRLRALLRAARAPRRVQRRRRRALTPRARVFGLGCDGSVC